MLAVDCKDGLVVAFKREDQYKCRYVNPEIATRQGDYHDISPAQIRFRAKADKGFLGQGKPRTLVIDDDIAVADSVAMVLTTGDFEATVESTGETGVELARHREFEFLVAGVLMSHMNGMEAAIEIREILPECKVLLVSGENEAGALLQEAVARVTNSNYSPCRCIHLYFLKSFVQSESAPRSRHTLFMPSMGIKTCR